MTYLIKSKPGCPHCVEAKKLIEATGEQLVEQIHETPTEIANFKAAGYKTFPQIFRNGVYVGGCDDLRAYLIDAEAF